MLAATADAASGGFGFAEETVGFERGLASGGTAASEGCGAVAAGTPSIGEASRGLGIGADVEVGADSAAVDLEDAFAVACGADDSVAEAVTGFETEIFDVSVVGAGIDFAIALFETSGAEADVGTVLAEE